MSIAANAAGTRILVQPGRNAFPDMSSYISEHFGFDLLQLSDYEIHRAQSKWAHLRGLIWQSFDLVRSLRRLRRCRVVIAIGPISYLIKLLKRLRLIRYEKSFCLGWHVRSPRWFPVFRALSRLDSGGDHYIVFSEWEIGLYQANLGIDAERMHFLPYGDWSGVGRAGKPRRAGYRCGRLLLRRRLQQSRLPGADRRVPQDSGTAPYRLLGAQQGIGRARHSPERDDPARPAGRSVRHLSPRRQGLHHPAQARYRRVGAERHAAPDAQPESHHRHRFRQRSAATSSAVSWGMLVKDIERDLPGSDRQHRARSQGRRGDGRGRL